MLLYGLKLWSSNSRAIFEEAARWYSAKKVDFVEIYHDATESLDYDKLGLVKNARVEIHNTNNLGWHEFIVGEPQLKIWQETLALADFYGSRRIVVHPGQSPNFESFQENLRKIDDSRILIENMPSLDMSRRPMYAQTLADLRQIRALKPICFDFEKAVKAACGQGMDYKNFILDCLAELQPEYFHISGGDKDSAVDEHGDLWEATFDVGWVARLLSERAQTQDLFLVFETPRRGDDLANDFKNMEYFRRAALASVQSMDIGNP